MVSLSCPQSRLRPRLDLPSNSNTSRSIAHSTSIPQRAQRCTSLAPTIVHRVFEVSGAHTQHTQSTGVESTEAAHPSAPLESPTPPSLCVRRSLLERSRSFRRSPLCSLVCFASLFVVVCLCVPRSIRRGQLDESTSRSSGLTSHLRI